MIEDTKVVINSRTSKDRQYNDQKKRHKTMICPSLDRKLNIYNQSQYLLDKFRDKIVFHRNLSQDYVYIDRIIVTIVEKHI
jgi:hypothetical protein